MAQDHENVALRASQLFRYYLPLLTVLSTSVLVVAAHGQSSTRPPGSPTPNNTCEGQQPSQTSPKASPSNPQSAGDPTEDRLELSAKSAQESADPEGQFCRRSDRQALKTTRSAEPDATMEPEQPSRVPPIAEVTDGKLTIRANGAGFASVLESLRSATGLTIEMPAAINSEPVFLNIGPVPITDALIALLDGTNYNYIIVGSAQDSRVVKRLILTERSSSGSGTLVASTQTSTIAPQPGLYGGQGFSEEAGVEPSEPPPPPPASVAPSVIPSSVPTGINIQKLAAESGKTPGQILDELQKRQQQVLDEQAASQSQSTGPQ